MADVFLSYSREDAAAAEKILQGLVAEGHSVWWDRRGNPDRPFDEVIEREIKAASVVVVVWSNTSVNSDWVRAEASYGQDRIAPVRIEPCDLPIKFHLIETADLTDWNGDRTHSGWRRLCSWIDSKRNRQSPTPETTPLPAAIPASVATPVHEPPPTPTEAPAAPATETPAPVASKSPLLWLVPALAVFSLALVAVIGLLLTQGGSPSSCAAFNVDARSATPDQDIPVATSSECLRGEFTLFRDCPDCPQMVTLPPGQFRMGASSAQNGEADERPVRDVQLRDPFAIGRFEVSWEEWMQCVSAVRCDVPGNPRDDRTGYLPVHALAWPEIQIYLTWLSEKTGETYRLPTEAEWEYAALAGETLNYTNTNNARDACASANIYDRTAAQRYGQSVTGSPFPCTDTFAYRAPVDSFRPNAFGLHNMMGNVYEAVEDCYRTSYEGASLFGDAVVEEDCTRYVARGGSYTSTERTSRLKHRYYTFPNDDDIDLGFRVVRELR